MKLKIKEVIERYFPGKHVKEIIDKGKIIKHTYKIVLDDNEVLYLKLAVHEEWSDLLHVKNVSEIFNKKGISSPKVLVIDHSKEILPYAFMIQEEVYGTKLINLLENQDRRNVLQIYEGLGRYLRKTHNITNAKSGIWSDNPYDVKYPISPNEYMFREEIVEGSGKKALEANLITKDVYNRIIKTFENNMEYLKNHTPTLINVSFFTWNVYLDRQQSNWEVTKVMSQNDVMWWDPAFEVALIKYPPFFETDEEMWKSFLLGYGEEPEDKRLILYSILQRLCANMGVFMEPNIKDKEEWIEKSFKEISRLLDLVEDK